MRDPLIDNVKVAPMLVMILLVFIAVAMSVYSKDVRPKIFVYDLPEKWHDEAKYGNEINAPSCFYSVDKLFPELLRASPYHTKNATEADFFYVGCMEADSHACWPLLHAMRPCWPLQAGGPYLPPHSSSHTCAG